MSKKQKLMFIPRPNARLNGVFRAGTIRYGQASVSDSNTTVGNIPYSGLRFEHCAN